MYITVLLALNIEAQNKANEWPILASPSQPFSPKQRFFDEIPAL